MLNGTWPGVSALSWNLKLEVMVSTPIFRKTVTCYERTNLLYASVIWGVPRVTVMGCCGPNRKGYGFYPSLLFPISQEIT